MELGDGHRKRWTTPGGMPATGGGGMGGADNGWQRTLGILGAVGVGAAALGALSRRTAEEPQGGGE